MKIPIGMCYNLYTMVRSKNVRFTKNMTQTSGRVRIHEKERKEEKKRQIRSHRKRKSVFNEAHRLFTHFVTPFENCPDYVERCKIDVGIVEVINFRYGQN